MAKKKAKKSLDELLEEALVKEGEQPYEVPGNWVFTKLGSICTKPQYGWTTKAKQEGDVYLVRTTDITSDNLDWQNVPYCSEVPKDLSKYLLKEDDIVISRAGSIGVSYLIEKPKKAVFASYLIRFNPIINKKYVYLFLKSPIYWSSISEKSSGIALPNINATKLGEIRFPLPPLTEQKRIVKKLSSMLGKLKEARELIREARDTFEERRAAILNKAFTGELTKKWREENPDVESVEKLIEMLITEKKKQRKEGKKEKIPTYEEMIIEESEQPYDVPGNWEFVSLGKLVQINPPKYKPEIGDDTLCSFVPMKAVSDKLGIIENIEEKPFGKIKNGYTSFKENDVLFAKITPCMENGKAAIAKNLINGFGYGSTEFFVFRCSTVVDNNFLYYLVRSKSFRDLAKPNMTGTVGQRRVQKDYLYSFKFPTPPLEEQKVIVRILEKLLDHEDEVRALIDMEKEIDLLEKSILSKAFSGELGTNDTNDEPASELLKRIQEGKDKQTKKREKKVKK